MILLDKLVGFTIKIYLANITLNIYQMYMVSKMDQVFNNGVKQL